MRHTFTGCCLCGLSRFTVDIENLNVYACHCTLCQKWSGDIAMYLEACSHPVMEPDTPAPTSFSSSLRGERYCGCPMWLKFTDNMRYSSPWTLLEFSEIDRRWLILAAEIYIESQPEFWTLTGQYARLRGKDVEIMDFSCQLV